MMEDLTKDQTFIPLFPWMINDLELEGTALIVFATIFSFCRTNNSFYGSIDYLCQKTGSKRRTVQRNIDFLIEKQLISKVENSGKTNILTINEDKITEIINSKQTHANLTHHPCQNDTPPMSIWHTTHDNLAHNNNIYNNIYNISERENSKNPKSEKTESSIPSLEEVKAVALENNIPSSVAEKFFYYYDARGWIINGRAHFLKWKSLFMSWVINENNFAHKEKQKSLDEQLQELYG